MITVFQQWRAPAVTTLDSQASLKGGRQGTAIWWKGARMESRFDGKPLWWKVASPK